MRFLGLMVLMVSLVGGASAQVTAIADASTDIKTITHAPTEAATMAIASASVEATAFTIAHASMEATAIAHAMPLSRKIIVVDAGHGGWDPGMVSNKVEEKGINLSIAKKLQVFLEQGGATVVVTRLEDVALGDKKVNDMHTRRIIANTSKADIFVSIHQNSYDSSSVRGFQAFYFNESDNSKKLAGCIQDRLKEFVNPGNKLSSKSNKNYFVLKQTEMPAVLVECGFLTNAGERGMLTTDEYQEKIAWGIYLGIVDYFV